jgi:hypothetical protein
MLLGRGESVDVCVCVCERERERECCAAIAAELSAVCRIMHYPCYCLNCSSFPKVVHNICDMQRVNACGILAVVSLWVKRPQLEDDYQLNHSPLSLLREIIYNNNNNIY